MEGLWGCAIYMGIFLPILNTTYCTFESTACVCKNNFLFYFIMLDKMKLNI